MAERISLSDGVASNISLPTIPRFPAISLPGVRSNNNSSSMRPSPLRESSLAPTVEDMSIECTSPFDEEKANSKIVTDVKEIIPLESTKVQSPFIIDGSGTKAQNHSQDVGDTDYNLQTFSVDYRGMDDPFVSPASNRSALTTSHYSPNRSIINHIQADIAVPSGNGFSPRPDRLGQQITASNAQALCPPEALVFLANLSNQRSDSQLEISCHKVFDNFGPCHVKIKRDRNNQPYAFLQFERIPDAELAIQGSRGIRIDGRSIRTEPAKASREVVLRRNDDAQITEQEVRSAMEPFGAIAGVYPVSFQDQQDKLLPNNGLWCKFAYFQDCKDAIWNFKNSEQYTIHVPPPDPRPAPYRPETDYATPLSVQRRRNTDDRSVFCGGLPMDICEDQLRQIFACYGQIDMLTIMRKPLPRGGTNVFAFVEFRNPRAAQAAALADIFIGQTQIRIERKEYGARRTARMLASTPQSPILMLPPTPPHPAQLEALHAYALHIGLYLQQAGSLFGMRPTNTMPFTVYPMNTMTPTRFLPAPAVGPYGSPAYTIDEAE